MFALVLMLLVGVSAAFSAPADAARPATPEERQVWANEIGGGVTADCVEGRVSTVDSSWAVAGIRRVEACTPGDGYFIFVLDETGWLLDTEGSDPLPCRRLQMPSSVGRDLAFEGGTPLCRRSRAHLLCAPEPGEDWLEVFRPRSCQTVGPGESLAEGGVFVRLTWKRWGRPVAFGRGFLVVHHHRRIPVRLRAYGRRDCNGDFTYTRLRATTRYGRGVDRFPRCP